MKMKYNLLNKRFGRLDVINYAGNGKWECLCDCGNHIIVYGYDLRNEKVKSCGCYKKDYIANKNVTHGLSNTRLFNIYYDMLSRCYDTNIQQYEFYGKRGILICNEWTDKEKGFINFYNWSIKNGYKDDLTIDRVNVNGDYEPNNCRWATMKEQSNNRRSNHNIELNGITKTISEWSEIYKINDHTVRDRLKRGWTEEDAIRKPTKK